MLKKVEVFNNPGKQKFIVRDYHDRGSPNYYTAVHLHDVHFVIDTAAQAIFQQEGRATQHAFLVAMFDPTEDNLCPKDTVDWTIVRYDPRLHSSFVDHKGAAVLHAEEAQLRHRHGKAIVFAKGVTYADTALHEEASRGEED